MLTPRLSEIAQIIKKGKNYQHYVNVSRIAGHIGWAYKGNTDLEGGLRNFDPTKKEKSTHDFVHKWGWWFGTRLIHFEDWQDICEEGLALTLKFIESDLEDATEMEGYKDIIKKISRRKTELQKSDKYTELQKRCWDDMGH